MVGTKLYSLWGEGAHMEKVGKNVVVGGSRTHMKKVRKIV